MSPPKLCGARTRAGGTCRRPAMRGTNRCDFHGGKSPQAQRAVVRRDEEAHALTILERLGRPEPLGHPIEELLALGAEVRAWQRILRERVSGLHQLSSWDRQGSEQERAVVTLYERSLDRTARLLTDLARLDLDTRLVRLAEADARILFDCLAEAIQAVGLSDEQAERFRRELGAALQRYQPAGDLLNPPDN